MNNEKMYLNIAPGCNEVVIREGKAPAQLEPKAPIRIDLAGTIGAPVAFLTKRIGDVYQHKCHVIVNREKVSITLVINEDDEYNHGKVVGKLSFHPKFEEFGINTGKAWIPEELGMFFKMNRAFFTDVKTNMELVSTFLSFKGNVNQEFDRETKMNGSYKSNFTQVVNSNMPDGFKLQIPIFRGMPAETLDVETFARVDGRDITIVLLSPGAECTLESIRDKVIDEQLDKIKEVAPEIVIIEE
jgi:hypothetical protein